jgi:thiosulfate/3-mercaptopyruvate sulfurtransferase
MSMLVSVETLTEKLHDPQWVVFDCRHDLMDPAKGERLYREGHVPGAHFANMDIDLSGEKTGQNGRHPLPSPAAFTAFLARHGVSNASTVVAYDDVGGQFAARLWWLARWIGLANVGLLNGGFSKWVADGAALSRDVPVPKPTALRGHANPLLVYNADEVAAGLRAASITLIDARAAERFRGEVEPIDPVAGHIPGAKNRFYKENLNADLTFRPADEIRAAFSAMTNRDAANVVHQCGSGVTACANIFAMELAGLAGSKLYAGSWSEWISDATRPVATGAAN